jgi:hypothetical protein
VSPFHPAQTLVVKFVVATGVAVIFISLNMYVVLPGVSLRHPLVTVSDRGSPSDILLFNLLKNNK